MGDKETYRPLAMYINTSHMSLYQEKTLSQATITNDSFWLSHLASHLEYIFSSAENIHCHLTTSVEHYI